MKRMLSPFEKNGSILSSGGGRLFYHRIDNPFVISVEALPRPDGTYICEWWVTGPTSPEIGSSPPILLLHLVMGLRCERDEVESHLETWWETRIQELTFGSAVGEGIIVDSKRLKELSDQTQHEIIHQHLYSHEMLQHFPGPNKPAKATLTVRTAFMYALLRSLGVSKVQKAIADFETLNFAGSWEEIQSGEEIRVSPETINQRLTHAKKLGLLQNLTPKKGRTPNAAKQIRGFSEQTEEFASKDNLQEEEADAKH
jgi:hypothetical protein